jgi:hypothetical protein
LARVRPNRSRHTPHRRLLAATLAIGSTGFAVAFALLAPEATAANIAPTSASWCTAHGSNLGGWAATKPALPICGPGPAYGGTWRFVNIPGPFGSLGAYFNATPGFQCVELAERFLSVVDGLRPVIANGAQVASNYHAVNPGTRLVVNGTSGAVGHAPAHGDVISLSSSSGFGGDGHVAIVVSSRVDGAGNGTVAIAQQNVSAADYSYTLKLSSWRLYDPKEPSNALFQFHYAEWLQVRSLRAAPGSTRMVTLTKPLSTVLTGASFGDLRRAAIRRSHTRRSHTVAHARRVTHQRAAASGRHAADPRATSKTGAGATT